MTDARAEKEITREKFSRFLEWLSPDLDRAVEEYERLRFRLRTFFLHRCCNYADDLTDETIDRVIRKNPAEIVDNKIAYFYGVARNVYRESLRKERPQVDIDEVTIAAPPPAEPSFSQECLDKCLAELSDENRTLVLDYFSEARQAKIQLHRRISATLKTSQTGLRMKVMRIKKTLKSCVLECMT